MQGQPGRHGQYDGLEELLIDNPTNDYDGFRSAPAALHFNGRVFGRSAFDTDRGWIVYRTDRPVAYVVERKVVA